MPKSKHTPGIHLNRTTVKRKVGAKFQYRSEYYWNIIASNGREICRSSETYARKANAVKSMKTAARVFCPVGGLNPYYYDHTQIDSPLKSYL